MKIRLIEGIPEVEGLPENCVVLFLGETQSNRYFVVFGPRDNCLSDEHMVELWDAEVGQSFVDIELRIRFELIIKKVNHGHKYSAGGGMVEFGDDQIFWRLASNPKPSTFNGEPFKKIFVAL